MSSPESLPDRLSANPKSPHYDEALLARGVGIKFNGNPMTIRLNGTVEPYLRNDGGEESGA